MNWTDRARLHAAGLTTAFLVVLVVVTSCLSVQSAELEDERSMTTPVERPAPTGESGVDWPDA
ncbi:MAG: hypothetical protein AAFZ65_20440 [Planctomycetota bacterium]